MAGPRNTQAVKSLINEIDLIGRFSRRYRGAADRANQHDSITSTVKQRQETTISSDFSGTT
jgi:hypothetical protein